MMLKVFRLFLLAIVGFLIFVFVCAIPALWRRWVTYPRFEKEVELFRQLRREPARLTELNTYQGVLHSHSYWSHDSEGTVGRIVPAARKAGVEFIFLTDHPHAGLDSFPRGYHGYYDGVLIEPGSEKHGYCAWPLDSAAIDWSVSRDTVIRNVVSRGGMFFYAHSEEHHNWSNPHYQGMEIYNIHTDTKDEFLLPHILNFIVNGGKYRQWALREIIDEQTSILSLWDSLNTRRRIVGFSAVDAHENQNIRARRLSDGRVEWLGPNADAFDTVEVTRWNRWMFHPPDDDGWVFEFMIDTYESSFKHVTNYVFADTLTVSSLSRHILNGNLYVAFNALADARGFMFCAQGNDNRVSGIMGDSVRIQDLQSLYAVSPLPGTFRLFRNGMPVGKSQEPSYEYRWTGPIDAGQYRIELHIKPGDKQLPWIYTNPIYVY